MGHSWIIKKNKMHNLRDSQLQDLMMITLIVFSG
jgi:hypothetical protein